MTSFNCSYSNPIYYDLATHTYISPDGGYTKSEVWNYASSSCYLLETNDLQIINILLTGLLLLGIFDLVRRMLAKNSKL